MDLILTIKGKAVRIMGLEEETEQCRAVKDQEISIPLLENKATMTKDTNHNKCQLRRRNTSHTLNMEALKADTMVAIRVKDLSRTKTLSRMHSSPHINTSTNE
jgi:hypothetical protein